jgi:hypothetical protein
VSDLQQGNLLLSIADCRLQQENFKKEIGIENQQFQGHAMVLAVIGFVSKGGGSLKDLLASFWVRFSDPPPDLKDLMASFSVRFFS